MVNSFKNLSENQSATDSAGKKSFLKSRPKWQLWTAGITVFLVVFATIFHNIVIYKVNQVINVEAKFGEELDGANENVLYANKVKNNASSYDESSFAVLEEASPFREIEAFDDEAKNWGTFAGQYGSCGLLLFDANGDNRLDAYFLNPGDNWVRPTDEKGVLLDKPRLQYNVLYLNQGNDEKGDPIYKRIDELAEANDTYVKEELLVENYLYPRESLSDSRERKGRSSQTAISVDLNGDGLKDLLVASGLEGMVWSAPETQRILGQFVRPVGRQANNVKVPMKSQGLGFIKDYQPRDNTHDKHDTGRGEEYMGANSIYLNMGDKDQDGIPEWKDITAESGLSGQRNTFSLLAADFDLDGDIDIFEGNAMDEDFWPGGSTSMSGGANQFYVNQLAETGELRFVEKSSEMNVDGLYDEDNPMDDYYRLKEWPIVPKEYSMAFMHFEPYDPGWLTINGQESEHGQLSWAAVTQDVNHDGYPDIWVANDLGWLRLYMNQNGEKFVKPEEYARHDKSGYWMSFSPADFNNDQKEDLFAGNLGGSSMNFAFSYPDPNMILNPVMTVGTMAQQYFADRHRAMHAIVDGKDFTQELKTSVKHSKVLPPDAAQANNVRPFVPGGRHVPYDINSLDPYEFTWGSTVIDVQNDGKKDLYWMGCLYGAGGGIFPIMGTGPGRLLVNATEKGERLNFVDLTAEYHVFNILELQYDKLKSDGYIYRKSPTKNWGKRSMVYSYDEDVWGLQGPEVLQKVSNRSMIQLAEEGRSVVAADLNNDGYQDMVVRNIGGYDSRKSTGVNLKAKIDGKIRVLPAHDANFPTPTNFEPGDSRVFINTHTGSNYLKVELVDNTEGSFNRHGVGAKVVINDQYLMVARIGGGGFLSNYEGPMHFGMAQEKAHKVQVTWPDKSQTVEVFELDDLANGILTIEKGKGIVKWIEYPLTDPSLIAEK
ncbi:MAG: CRTAC1 family protein [Bacteroidota bacterium]